jgi:hypothetical protein
MIERLDGMPDGTIGLRVTGRITRDDYMSTLVPVLQEAIDAGRGLRALYLIEDLHAMEPAALWADAKAGFDLGVRHHSEWKRSAIVTDIEWMATASRMFAWMVPGEFRVFPVAELEQAKTWIAGGA